MAGSMKNSFETDLLNLIFANEDIANIGDAGGLLGSVADGSFYIALYTVTPSDSAAGTECTYTGYARKAIARDDTKWTVADNAYENTAVITFDPCTAGSETAVSFAVCKADVEDVDDQILWGDLTSSLAISNGITPEFAAGALSGTAD